MEELKTAYRPVLEKITRLAAKTSGTEDDALAAEAARGYSRICFTIGVEYCKQHRENPTLKERELKAENYLREAMEIAVATNDPLKESIKNAYGNLTKQAKTDSARRTYGSLGAAISDACYGILGKRNAGNIEAEVTTQVNRARSAPASAEVTLREVNYVVLGDGGKHKPSERIVPDY